MGSLAEAKEHVGNSVCGVEARMAAKREETAVKYVLIEAGQGERWRFSMGVAAAMQAREERMR